MAVDVVQPVTSASKTEMRRIKHARDAQDVRGWRRALRVGLWGAVLAVIMGIAVVLATTNHSYVYTPSMYPTIPPGSMIFVKHEPSYHVGEVIEFRANGLIWAHRLIAIKSNGDLVTKGDNPASRPDVFYPALRMSDVVGKVVYAPRFLGFPQLFVSHPRYALGWFVAEIGLAGKVALVSFVAALCGLYLWRTSRRDRVNEGGDRESTVDSDDKLSSEESSESI
ncbi:MAG: signal peptidase I [Ferrimicrobium sp.]